MIKCGRSSVKKGKKSGSGSPWSAKPAAWLGSQPVTVLRRPVASSRPRFHPNIGNARCITPISGTHTRVSSHRNGIVLVVRKRVKRRTSNGSTTPCASAVPISCAKLSHSAKIFGGTKCGFGCSLTTIIVSLNSIGCLYQFRLGHYQ